MPLPSGPVHLVHAEGADGLAACTGDPIPGLPPEDGSAPRFECPGCFVLGPLIKELRRQVEETSIYVATEEGEGD